ncbi:MAG: DUF4349 domain-containing protein [Candidatus Dormibacteraeota bacterium]|nr:DUF4349 domain-containing protein [Candidatus Dormibacteraeota bacterium]
MSIRHIAAILFGTAALAGCASGATSTSDGAPQVATGQGLAHPAAAAPAQSGFSTASIGQNGTSIIVGTPPNSDIERSVNAAYTVAPSSFLTSFEAVIARGVGLGGYVVSSATQPDSGGRIVSGTVTLKVPAAKLADLLNAMPTSFVASSINFSAIDHTGQFVDVNARLASAHAHLAALDALLAKATSIGDISTLEQEIEAVQTEVDTDQGQLNVLTASVELATATVHLSERGATVAPVTAANPVSSGLGGGWDNAVRVTGAVLEGAVSALPLLILLAAGLLVWRRLSRAPLLRRRSAGPE